MKKLPNFIQRRISTNKSLGYYLLTIGSILIIVGILGLVGYKQGGTPIGASSSTLNGASLATCSTSPCTSGQFSYNVFTTCGSTPQVLSGNVIQVGAVNNNVFNENYCYAWYKPANINSTPAATLILFAHCSGASCAGSVPSLGWQWIADHNALNIVYFYSPFGSLLHTDTDYPAPPTNAQGTTCPGAYCSDEPGVAAVVNDILHGMGSTKIKVDPNRIYATGASSGGTMMDDIACTPNQNLFRGVSIVSAHVQLAQSSTTNGHEVPGTERCPTAVSHPFFLFEQHGTSDTNVPFNGTCNFGSNDHCIASDTETRRFWSAHLGCKPSPTDSFFGSPQALNIKHAYTGCAYGLTPAYEAETVTNGGHTDCPLNDKSQLPSPSICFGSTQTATNGYFTAQEAWNFWAASQWSSTSPTTPPPTGSGSPTPSSSSNSATSSTAKSATSKTTAQVEPSPQTIPTSSPMTASKTSATLNSHRSVPKGISKTAAITSMLAGSILFLAAGLWLFIVRPQGLLPRFKVNHSGAQDYLPQVSANSPSDQSVHTSALQPGAVISPNETNKDIK